MQLKQKLSSYKYAQLWFTQLSALGTILTEIHTSRLHRIPMDSKLYLSKILQ